MSLYTASLNSGSNGNCYYISNGKEAVLVDAGISCRETEKRMRRLQIDPHKVKAIFISHEHSDHIRGVEVLSKKYKLPVYITERTLHYSKLTLKEDYIRSFKDDDSIQIGNLSVTAFSKSHDASDPYSFTVEGNGTRVAVITDIGIACTNVIEHFRNAHAAFLETNYDEDLLENGPYPIYLKRRIKSDEGHLSNSQALKLFLDHKPEFMSHLFLSHLSRDNNSPQLVKKLFEQHSGDTRIIVASRDYETDLYQIHSNKSELTEHSNVEESGQISLF
jgi:phosphoribosyl 1,2-cyclic phosphodiesterase